MKDKQKYTKEYYAKNLADHFGIDLNDQSLSISSLLGGYIEKIEKIFETDNKVITFKAHGSDRISSNLFPYEYKRGSGNTYYYVKDVLEFFKVKTKTKYNENKMLKNGWLLPDIATYKSFDDYLINTKNEIDFDNTKKIFTSIFVFLYGETTEFKSINMNMDDATNQMLSRYSRMFDSIYLMVFKVKTPFAGERPKSISRNVNKNMTPTSKDSSIKQEPLNIKIEAILDKEISKLTYFANSIKNTENPAEEKRLINYNRHVIKLRTIHREDLKEEFNTFKAAHNIIDEYITTYNLEKPFGNVQEAAHIVPVSDLIKEERFEDIGNKENGILLDPTTHKMFDKGLLLFSGDNTMLVSNPEKFPFEFEYKIPNGLLTDSRIEYIKEWKERFQKDND